jgi:hypothetical protein
MASALRTDPRCFRLLAAADPVVIELREWSRIGGSACSCSSSLRGRAWLRPCRGREHAVFLA